MLSVLFTAISPVPRAMPKISLTPEKSVLDEHITKHAVIPSQDIRMCAVIGARGKGVECMQTLGMVKVGDRKREGPVHTHLEEHGVFRASKSSAALEMITNGQRGDQGS